MKKNLILAAFAVVAMASCSKTEVADPTATTAEASAIGFTTFIDRVTKGTAATQTTLQTNGFNVFAYETDGTAWATGATANRIMDDVAVSYTGADAGSSTEASWSYETLKYWANNANISFFAYSPYIETTSDGTATDIAVPTIAFEANTTLSSQVDLLAASSLGVTNTGSPVDFNFDHILSKIGFLVLPNVSSGYVKVTDVKLSVVTGTTSSESLKSNGTYKFATPEDDDAYWTVGSTALVITDAVLGTTTIGSGIVMQAGETTPESIMDDSDYLMIVPQEMTGEDIIKLVVTYKTAETDSWADVSTDQTKTVYVPAITYEMGKQYTYTIKVGQDAIKFSTNIGVTSWTNGSTTVLN